jgi:protein gp37
MIFVSDMSDALSKSVSFEYLDAEVIAAVTSSEGQRHRWLWLTKQPSRMAEFSKWLSILGQLWPENLWAGTSITSKKAIGRIISLLKVGDNSTMRFLSVEPQVEPISLAEWLPELDWVIQGGESGGDPRAFELTWARRLAAECSAARVPYFLKQLGAHPVEDEQHLKLRDRHGGDWSAWPEELRRREVPGVDSRYTHD